MYSTVEKTVNTVSSWGIDYVTVGSLTLFGLIIIGLGFLIIREWVCWYAKINERILLQQKTNALLEAVLERLSEGDSSQTIVKRGNSKVTSKREVDSEIIESVVSDRGGNKTITINL